MASITFRFTTECEITLEGCSHQEAYLRFKDLCQQKKAFNPRNVTPPVTPFDGPSCHVYPPEENTVMFEIDEQNQFSSMTMQGNYPQDILANLPANWLTRIDASGNKLATALASAAD